MKTVAEIYTAIQKLSPKEKKEVELYLRELIRKDFQKADNENQKPKHQS
jgi:hypothetical protein